MAAENKSREVRVFISSTFKDMHKEREYLINNVFPEIRSICYERCVLFTEIDLRWGVDENALRNGGTVEVCLQEIDYCREFPPFFIGILGERYGWVPNKSELDIWTNTQATEKYAAQIRGGLKDGISVTELEIRYAMSELFADDHVLFLLRSEKLTKEICDEKMDFYENNEEYKNKLRILKDRLIKNTKKNESINLLDGYTSIEEFGNKVKQQLVAAIDKKYPPEEVPNEAERELNLQKAELTRLCEAFCPDEYINSRLSDYVDDLTCATSLMLIGESGIGKSSTLAYWLSHRPQVENVDIIYHFCGIGTVSTVSSWMKRVIHVISDKYAIAKKAPSTDEDIQNVFIDWLSDVPSNKELIIVLDAVNQLQADGYDLFSHNLKLHEKLPVNVKFIWSVTSEFIDRYHEPNCKRLAVELFNDERAKLLVQMYLKARRKTPDNDLIEAILDKRKDKHNPLFLNVLLEELVATVHYKEDATAESSQVSNSVGLYHKLSSLGNSKTFTSLFKKVLIRMDRDIELQQESFAVPSHALGLIAVSRGGLSRNELRSLLQTNDLGLSLILAKLRVYLSNIDGRFTVMHVAIRNACLSIEGAEIERRKELISYFEIKKVPTVGSRSLYEALWQHYLIVKLSDLDEDWCEFAQVLSSLPTVCALAANNQGRNDLLAYWLMFSQRGESVEAGRRRLAEKDKLIILGKNRTKRPPGSSIPIGKWLLALGKVRGLYGASMLRELAKFVFEWIGDYALAQKIYQQVILVYRNTRDINSSDYALVLVDYCFVLNEQLLEKWKDIYELEFYEVNRFQEENKKLEATIYDLATESEQVLKTSDNTEVRGKLVSLFYRINMPDKAEMLLNKLEGADDLYFLVSRADANLYRKNYSKSIHLFKKALSKSIFVNGQSSRATVDIRLKLAGCFYSQLNYPEAEKNFGESIQNYRALYGQKCRELKPYLMCNDGLLQVLYHLEKYKRANEVLIISFSSHRIVHEKDEECLEKLIKECLMICRKNEETNSQKESIVLLLLAMSKLPFYSGDTSRHEMIVEEAYHIKKTAKVSLEYGLGFLNKRRFSEAEVLFNESFSLDNGDLTKGEIKRLSLGMLMVKSKLQKYPDAIGLLNRLRELDEDSNVQESEYLKNLTAVLYAEKGDLQQSHEMFTSILERGEAYYLNLAQITYLKGDYASCFRYSLKRLELLEANISVGYQKVRDGIRGDIYLQFLECLRDLMTVSVQLDEHENTKEYYHYKLPNSFAEYDYSMEYDKVQAERNIILNQNLFENNIETDAELVKRFQRSVRTLNGDEYQGLKQFETIVSYNDKIFNKFTNHYCTALASNQRRDLSCFQAGSALSTFNRFPYNQGYFKLNKHF